MFVDVASALTHLDAFLERARPGYEADRGLADTARALSVAYTETRAIADDAAADLAYLAHFGPRAVVAMARALASVPAVDMARARVVDIGAGSGASALAWVFAGVTDLTLVERSGPALALAGQLLPLKTRRHQGHINSFAYKEMTHASAAFVVGELDRADTETALGALAPTVIVVDAGDRPRARRLQEARDRLVLRADAVVHGPCAHRDPCPALVRERDWCHDRVDKTLPPRLAAFSRLVGRDDAAMSLAWLTWSIGVRHEGVTDVGDVVVIGEARREKGRTRLPVCGPSGLRFLQTLHRDKALTKGVEGLVRGTRLRVTVRDEDGPADTAVLRGAAGDAFVADNAAALSPS